MNTDFRLERSRLRRWWFSHWRLQRHRVGEAAGGDGNASFPEVSDSWSPDGRFVVKNVDHPKDATTPHSIYLTDMETGRRTVLYSYPRKVDLYWSPASDALAINDWDANDDAQCIVFILAPRPARIDVREEFLKSRRPDRRSSSRPIATITITTTRISFDGSTRRRCCRCSKGIAPTANEVSSWSTNTSSANHSACADASSAKAVDETGS